MITQKRGEAIFGNRDAKELKESEKVELSKVIEKIKVENELAVENISVVFCKTNLGEIKEITRGSETVDLWVEIRIESEQGDELTKRDEQPIGTVHEESFEIKDEVKRVRKRTKEVGENVPVENENVLEDNKKVVDGKRIELVDVKGELEKHKVINISSMGIVDLIEHVGIVVVKLEPIDELIERLIDDIVNVKEPELSGLVIWQLDEHKRVRLIERLNIVISLINNEEGVSNKRDNGVDFVVQGFIEVFVVFGIRMPILVCKNKVN